MTTLLLIGCGHMGGALLARWQQSLPAPLTHIDVVDPAAAPKHDHRVSWHRSLDELGDAPPEIVVLAVKPQSLDALLPQLAKRYGDASPLYLSIAAGKTLSYLKHFLGKHAHIVRAMPNMPAAIGAGMTALYAESTVNESSRHLADALMRAAGRTLWLADESQMHAATALSGSGPAYCFYFLECLASAGIDLGLPEEMARTMALYTLHGSAALALGGHQAPADLRQQVTSPGGTTEAALGVLMQDETFRRLIGAALTAAERRSRELAAVSD